MLPLLRLALFCQRVRAFLTFRQRPRCRSSDLFLSHSNPVHTMAPRIDNLPAEELKAALSVDPAELPEEEALAVEDFVRRIGGRENAMAAVQLLEEIEGNE